MDRLNIIGPGRVGQTVLRIAGRSDRLSVQDVTGRRLDQTQACVEAAGIGRAVGDLRNMRAADLWMLSVPDDAIAQTAQALATSDLRPSVAFHCSGFLAADALAPLRGCGWSLASCHPVRSFADPVTSAAEFAGTYCAVEGDATALPAMTRFVETLGGRPFAISSEKKPLYHAAAVFSNNFTTVLQAIAQEAWAEAGVSEEVARALGKSLLNGTADSVAQLGPQAALTGPAARGDTALVEKQAAAVADWHPEAGRLYAAFSRLAYRLKDNGRTD